MRYHSSAILFCLCAIAIFAALAHSVSNSVIQRGIHAIEMRQAAEDMLQLRGFLRMSEQRMRLRTMDWACWDEAYAFMQNHDEDFIHNNFDQEVLQEQHLAMAVYYDMTGTMVACVDGGMVQGMEGWLEEAQDIFRKLVGVILRGGLDGLDGFATVKGGSFVVAAHKVYDGNKSQPARGVLIMASPLDSTFIATAAKLCRLRFSVFPASSFGNIDVATDPDTGFKFLPSSDTIRVYSVLYDVFGQAALCLELRRDRKIAVLGNAIAEKNFWLMLGLGCLVFLGGIILLRHVQHRYVRQEMAWRMSHDSLTKLPDNALFTERLRTFLATARGKNSCVGVFFLHLDGFTGANCSLSHAQVEELLREAARRLRSLTAGKLLGRSTGDAFLAAVDAPHRAALAAQGQGFLEAMDKPFATRERSLHLGTNIGLAVFPDDGEEATLLLHRAELAMFCARDRGGNSITAFTAAMEEAASRKQILENALYQAVEEESLTVYYQPTINVPLQDVVGCEALIRWQTCDGTWVPPLTFIPLAEECGLITRIDMFVLRSACKQVLAWAHDGSGTVPVAVNISARSIQSVGFADQVLHIVQEEGTPPELIRVEITETSLMTNLDAATAAIRRLHQAGIRTALDDFGTGYSSMQYLYAMPLAALKIDKRFIDSITAPENDSKALVKGMLALASNLGIATVAEGVEKQEQLSFLSANHCTIIQGYLFSRPLNSQDCGLFLRQRHARIGAVANHLSLSPAAVRNAHA